MRKSDLYAGITAFLVAFVVMFVLVSLLRAQQEEPILVPPPVPVSDISWEDEFNRWKERVRVRQERSASANNVDIKELAAWERVKARWPAFRKTCDRFYGGR